ncbi:NAD(P)-binding protein [Corynespora cassiicola Philippines]|uniref:NAD(P)-binding protein n=1 Tax=Corynespora cassiicola Philippines TaxID=1448308 RepID=A0A2T2N0G7_CORCC|nr:NAD(P)-binding protein [Corynespora cassiicola Philippines]
MFDIKNVVIVGAGGNLGPTILQTFLESSSFNISVLSREGSSSTFPPGVNVIRANYQSIDSLKSVLIGQDAVISLVGGNSLGDQKKLIDAAISAGVKRFIPSEFGSNSVDERVRAIVPFLAAKTGTVDYLKSKESIISWTSVITGPFFDWGFKIGFFGNDVSSNTFTMIDGGDAVTTTSTLHQIGLTLVKVLEKADESKNQYVYVASFNLSQKEILTATEKMAGLKWTIMNVTSKDLQESGNSKLERQDFSGIIDLIQAVAFNEAGYGDHRKIGLWNRKLGLPEEDFEDVLRISLAGKLVGEK